MSVTSEEIRYVGKLECQMNIRISLHENVAQISDVPPGGKYLQKNDREFSQFVELQYHQELRKRLMIKVNQKICWKLKET